MMPRSARQILIVLLAALHLIVAVGGSCLHSLPGWDHSAVSTRRPVQAGQHDAPVKAPHTSTHDCPVCHFLSQGQLPTETATGLVPRLCCVLVSLSPPHSA